MSKREINPMQVNFPPAASHRCRCCISEHDMINGKGIGKPIGIMLSDDESKQAWHKLKTTDVMRSSDDLAT